MKTKYKGFKVGDKVKLIQNIHDYNTMIPSGTIFKIISFAPCVTPCHYDYFVYGKTLSNDIRCFVNQITKI